MRFSITIKTVIIVIMMVVVSGNWAGMVIASETPASRDLEFGDWNVNGTEEFNDTTITVTGDINITGNLTMENVTLLLESGPGKRHAIRISESGKFEARNSTVWTLQETGSFHIHVLGALELHRVHMRGLGGNANGSGILKPEGNVNNLTIANCTFDDAPGTVIEILSNGASVTDNKITTYGTHATGLKVISADTSIINNEIYHRGPRNSTTALHFEDLEEAIMTGNRISGTWTGVKAIRARWINDTVVEDTVVGMEIVEANCTYHAIHVRGANQSALRLVNSEIAFMNSSFSSAGTDVLIIDTEVWMLNCTYSTTEFVKDSFLGRWWLFDVKVIDLQGSPVEGARVKSYEAGTSSYYPEGRTDENGRIKTSFLCEYWEEHIGNWSGPVDEPYLLRNYEAYYEIEVEKGMDEIRVPVRIDKNTFLVVRLGEINVWLQSWLVNPHGTFNVGAVCEVDATLFSNSADTPPVDVALEEEGEIVSELKDVDFEDGSLVSISIEWIPKAEGVRNMTLIVDPYNDLDSSILSDNSVRFTVEVGAALPDLVIENISFNRSRKDLITDTKVTVYVTVRNQGLGDAGAFVVCFGESFHGINPETDCRPVWGLGANSTVNVSIVWVPDYNGNYTVSTVVDYYDDVQESLEYNNKCETRVNAFEESQQDPGMGDFILIAILFIFLIIVPIILLLLRGMGHLETGTEKVGEKKEKKKK
jgi:hypothetical protein